MKPFFDILTVEREEDSKIVNWEDIPSPLIKFLQAQDGLKFSGRGISCRSHLETAFYLLDSCEGNPEALSILILIVWVLTAYGWKIAQPRNRLVDDLLVLRSHPSVIPRKCSGCDQEYLDDSFPYWSKADPDRYVTWYKSKSNCGRPICEAASVIYLPIDRLLQ